MQPQDPTQPPTPPNQPYPQTPPQNPDPAVVTPTAPDPYATPATPTPDQMQPSQPMQPVQPAQPLQQADPYAASDNGAVYPSSPAPSDQVITPQTASQPADPYATVQTQPEYSQPTVTNPVNQMDPNQWFTSDAPASAVPIEPIEQPKPKRKLLFASMAMLLLIGASVAGWFMLSGSNGSQSSEVSPDAGVSEVATQEERFPEELPSAEATTEESNAENSEPTSTPTDGSTTTSNNSNTSTGTSTKPKANTSTSTPKTTAKPTAAKPAVAAYSISCSASKSEQSRVSSALLTQAAISVRAAYNGQLASLTSWTPAGMQALKGNQTAIQNTFKQIKPSSCVIVASLKANPEGTAYSLFAEFPKTAAGSAYRSTIMVQNVSGKWRTAAITAPVKK